MLAKGVIVVNGKKEEGSVMQNKGKLVAVLTSFRENGIELRIEYLSYPPYLTSFYLLSFHIKDKNVNDTCIATPYLVCMTHPLSLDRLYKRNLGRCYTRTFLYFSNKRHHMKYNSII